MRFVVTKTLAGELRGRNVAEALGVPCDQQYTAPDEWVVFVKTQKGMDHAKRDGCRVAFDPVDYYCYDDGRAMQAVPEVDLLIVPNPACAVTYKQLFPKADFLVIPHQWDQRITGQAEHDTFRPGYIGRKFNLGEVLNIETVTEQEQQLAALPRFNCHVAQRAWQAAASRKPATKVASAAAVGAVVVTTPDESAKHLLGPGYPFYVKGTLLDALHEAKRSFGSQRWHHAREIMARVKEQTSMGAILDYYRLMQ